MLSHWCRPERQHSLHKKTGNLFAFFSLHEQINVKGIQQLPCSVVRAAELVKMTQLQK